MKSLKMFLLAVGCFVAMASTGQNQQSKSQMNAQKLATTLYLIENFYVDTANTDKVTEDAIIAALKELDPHSAYISKKDVEKANEPLVGSFEGIGVTFQLIRDTITVISPTAGGPSEKVGIMAGDQFIKIDGEEAFGKKVDNEYVQKHLRGKKDTKVTVSVKRGDDSIFSYFVYICRVDIEVLDEVKCCGEFLGIHLPLRLGLLSHCRRRKEADNR